MGNQPATGVTDRPSIYPPPFQLPLTQVEALNEDMLGRVLSVMEETETHGWEFVTARKGITVHRKFMVRWRVLWVCGYTDRHVRVYMYAYRPGSSSVNKQRFRAST